MLRWIDIIKYANSGTPAPDRKVEKRAYDRKALLTPEQHHNTRLKDSESAHSTDLYSLLGAGNYACICCDTLLFDGNEEFESNTGWLSFTQPVKDNAVAYIKDVSCDGVRIDALCNTCNVHIGHVFQDGPKPGGLRYAINATALKKVESLDRKLTIGGGCFWCTEAVFNLLEGVTKVVSGYSGGKIHNPTYKEVSSGLTGHAEVVEITYNPAEIYLKDLLRIHLSTHNAATLIKQGSYTGTQYRSIIFYRNKQERETVVAVVNEMQEAYADPIVTEIVPYEQFYNAEQYHQEYYANNPDAGYCRAIIEPELKKFKSLFKDKMKIKTVNQ